MERIFHRSRWLSCLLLLCCPLPVAAQSTPSTGAGDGISGAPEAVPLPSADAVTERLPSSGALSSGGRGGLGVSQFFGYVYDKHAMHKAKLKASPLGKLCRGIKKPLSMLTGGLIPAESPPNTAELAASGPQGAAAKIKQDQLDAPQRLAAVQALADVDCHWYPEAQTALVNALRTDRSECVRYEAARILSQTGCCNSMIIEALKICVAGSQVDGNPSENSVRVRNQAAYALERCLAICGESAEPGRQFENLRPEYPVEPAGGREQNGLKSPSGGGSQSRPDVVSASATARLPTSGPTLAPDVMSVEEVLQKHQALQEATHDPPPKSIIEAWRRASQ